MRGLKIGSVRLENPLFLAPMVDVTDAVYRLLCRRAGVAITYTEMLHAQAILHPNELIRQKLYFFEESRPVGVQITSNALVHIRNVAPFLKSFDLVDLNCGCPSTLTVDHGSGSYLLRTPQKIARFVSTLKKEGYTVTAKIRLGYRKNTVLSLAKTIEKAGADAITVHARLGHQGRSVPADWNELKKVKAHVGIPVIGNGDVHDEESAAQMLAICDGAMIARAAIGDPMLFSRILHYLKTGKKQDFDFQLNMKLFSEYLHLCEQQKLLSMNRAKYLGGNFIQRVDGARELRNQFMKLRSFDAMREFVEKRG